MSNDDISHLFNSISLSTTEEKLTQQLDQTHIDAKKAPSIFSIQQQQQQQQQQWQPSNNQQGWNPNENEINANLNQQEEDGWGDAPPNYTAISQGTYFGFNSIMQTEIYNHTTTGDASSLPQNSKAFSKYKNNPVTFNSALNDINNNQK